MICKKNILWFGLFLICLPSVISANLTTFQYWDPAPVFNAANLNMPPDTQFCYSLKQRMLDEDIDKHRRWGINVSPFVQRAIRAQQTDSVYFGVHGNNSTTPGMQMGDFQGTPYLMGLFLGQAPNGNSIWGGPVASDTGNVNDITTANVAATDLPFYLQDAINALNDNANEVAVPYNHPNAIMYNATSRYTPSILSQSILESDPVYFGAFSVPLTYQKAGFRWEVNLDICDHLGFLVRGGLVQITQRTAPQIPLSVFAPPSSTDSTQLPDIYGNLLTVETYTESGTGLPVPLAQNTFNQWVTNNIDNLLDATNGADYDITTFAETGVEDIQILGFFRHSFPIYPANPDEYSSMILTPYAMFGWTIPIAPVRDYSKLYALPFGNNSHTSIGGVVGITFDFIDSIEFGFEFGATGFLKKQIDGLPVPNHMLQRVIYPWREDVMYSPGFNGQFAFIFNAYEFAQNTSFSFRYNYVQHNEDTITLIVPNQYFLPSQLEEQSAWTSQMFVAALTFEIQPSVFISVAWQGALAQKNAYVSNTILGSLNFMF